MQQAALVLDELAEVYPKVTITGKFASYYDYPGFESQDRLYHVYWRPGTLET